MTGEIRMDNLVTLQGIVLQHNPVGDYDWVVTILTLERGKITAFARGARRPNSHLTGTVEPFCFGNFKMFEGRTSYNIAEAEISNYFEGFRRNLEEACYGTFFLELADYYSRENSDAADLLGLLYLSLRALEKENLDNRLIRCIYEIRALVINGEFPGMPQTRQWNETTEYTVNYIASAQAGKLYTFRVSPEILQELCDVSENYRRRFIDRPLKSLEMLKVFEAGVEKP